MNRKTFTIRPDKNNVQLLDKLAERAKKKKCTLNKYIIDLLAKTVKKKKNGV